MKNRHLTRTVNATTQASEASLEDWIPCFLRLNTLLVSRIRILVAISVTQWREKISLERNSFEKKLQMCRTGLKGAAVALRQAVLSAIRSSPLAKRAVQRWHHAYTSDTVKSLENWASSLQESLGQYAPPSIPNGSFECWF